MGSYYSYCKNTSKFCEGCLSPKSITENKQYEMYGVIGHHCPRCLHSAFQPCFTCRRRVTPLLNKETKQPECIECQLDGLVGKCDGCGKETNNIRRTDTTKCIKFKCLVCKTTKKLELVRNQLKLMHNEIKKYEGRISNLCNGDVQFHFCFGGELDFPDEHAGSYFYWNRKINSIKNSRNFKNNNQLLKEYPQKILAVKAGKYKRKGKIKY